MKCGLFILLCLAAISVRAQTYVIKKLGLEHGLSNNYVVSIAQDKTGYIWVATESGLNRFDGKEFKTYKKYFGIHEGVSGNELNKIVADTYEPIVWIATQRAGLNRFDSRSNSFTLFSHNPDDPTSIASDAITDITSDDKGNLWVATFYNGVDYYDKNRNEFIHYNNETISEWVSNKVWTVADDNKGHLYVGHVDAGLSVFSHKSKTTTHYLHDARHKGSLPDNEVKCIFIDTSGNVWVGTAKGLALFHPQTGAFTCFTHNKYNPNSIHPGAVFSIAQMEDNRLWIGIENGGVSILDAGSEMFLSPENISFHNLRSSDDAYGLSHPTVRAMCRDAFNNIWIGTYGGGVNFISHEPDLFFKMANNPNVKQAWGMCEDAGGRIWVGADGGGIQVFDNEQPGGIYTKDNTPLSDNAILAALKDSEDNLWFGTFTGAISIYHAKEKIFKAFLPGQFHSHTIRCFFEDKDCNIWIGTDGNGMYAWNLRNKTLKNFSYPAAGVPNDNLVRAIAQDKQGRLWTGSFGQGLSVLDNNFQAVKTYLNQTGFYSNTINCLYRDSRDRMWVGTGEGLVVFETENLDSFRIYTEKDGLANSCIRAITEDHKGDLWFSTNEGIGMFSQQQQRFYNYGRYDGVPLGAFMNGSVVNSKSGILYFGSQNGVCRFEPSQLPAMRLTPPVVLTGYQAYGDEQLPALAPLIRLKHTQNTFSIYFNVMDYALADKIEYAYNLGKKEKEWYSAQQTNRVTFRNLSPGRYTFAVKARANNQDWPEDFTSVEIEILPPLWLTWWAKLLYAAITAWTMWFLIRFYKKRIQLENMLYWEKQNSHEQQMLNNEKLRFFTNITHELRTPLTLIISPLQELFNENGISPKARKKISLIYQNSLRLLDLINKILDFRKTETDSMPLRVSRGDLAQQLKETGLKYAELNRNDKVSFRVDILTGQTVLFFDPEIIGVITDNLISNAFKNTEQGEIVVTLRTIDDDRHVSFTEIEVKDTGCGIPPEELDRIFDRYYQVKSERHNTGTGIGLALVKNLAKVHQAEIFVESEQGKGSAFRLRLETHNTYPDAFRHDENADGSPADDPLHNNADELPQGKKLILVVEDNIEILHYIKDSLDDDYAVATAANGQEGLELALQNIPDMIISDIMMPLLSGLALCQQLKKDIRTSHIPIILLTAKTSLMDKTEGYDAGADSYLTKPFSVQLLKSRIQNLFDSRACLARQILSSYTGQQILPPNALSRLDNELLQKITTLIRENSYAGTVDIEFIAHNVYMSHSSLYRKIKALTGLSINEYIRKVKMNYAGELLLGGRHTVSEVAFQLGVNSITYFRQCFKEEYGMTPSEYTKKKNLPTSY